MDQATINVLNKLNKGIINGTIPVTVDDIEDFISSKTHYEVKIDSQKVLNLSQEVRSKLGISLATAYFGLPLDQLSNDDAKNKKMRVVEDFNLFDNDDLYDYASATELLMFYAQYKKTDIVALGSPERVGSENYYLAINKSGKFIMVNLGSIHHYNKLIVERL